MGRNKIDKDCLYYLQATNSGCKDWCSKAGCKCKLGSSYCECDYEKNSDFMLIMPLSISAF